MTQEQKTAEAELKSARLYLAYARCAFEALPGNTDVLRRFAKAVEIEQAAELDYMAIMTAGLAAEIQGIVPDAFRD